MIHAIRRMFQSKLGVAITLGFLALIALAFASADVSSTGTFGGVAGGDRVAVVGDQKIGTAELSGAAQSNLQRARQENPNLSMQAFLAQNGLAQTLDVLVDRTALAEFARKIGFTAGDNLVNSEIRKIPAFSGPDGNFDESAYRAAIAQQGLTDREVREDLSAGLLAQQVLVPASFGTKMPQALTQRYGGLFRERRKGSLGILLSQAYAPEGDPTDKQLQAFYNGHRDDYIRPERRVIRYATFGPDAVKADIEPTDQEIAARYKENAANYAPSEERTLSQLIVPSQAAAKAIADKVRNGGSFEQAAQDAGLELTQVGPITRRDFAGRASPAVAQAVFEADRGSVAPPTRSNLGWYVVRVDSVEQKGGRSLAQMRDQIADAIRAEKKRAALGDLAASIEDRFSDGESLADVAKSLGAQVQATRPITGSGQVYGAAPNETAPEVLAPALQTAFQMQEGQPQLAEVRPGEEFLLFEAGAITPSASAPLKEIRDDVVADWRMAEGAAGARKASERVLARMKKGQSLQQAMAAENKRLPPPENLNVTREELLRNQQGVIPPLALFFSMAQNTTKRLAAPRDGGWFIVDLDSIEPGKFSQDDPLFAQVKRELGSTLGQEYAQQLRTAIRKDVGVKRNEDAIAAVRKQLAGES
ncbi:SurA N-terminal domain-containing protein [Erythrobacter sp. LQ02-29]|uniref:peptidyl-prolyl cis-trans isomerase n=1 Tax=Erythrobacter sp. LQ02-29 TaxID=2920384 RepID=UPI001F4E64E9|nr:SurA N-terminal domain-containing protein [Erythrobacter sp. LQ02-29]MCP9223300.1 SurA N-terminal domain-containing protein [Erythrobacter sp. LQ02-29]